MRHGVSMASYRSAGDTPQQSRTKLVLAHAFYAVVTITAPAAAATDAVLTLTLWKPFGAVRVLQFPPFDERQRHFVSIVSALETRAATKTQTTLLTPKFTLVSFSG